MISHVQQAAWSATAQRVFAAHPSFATVSVVSAPLAERFGHGDLCTSNIVHASSAALPMCFINPAVADLLPRGEMRDQIEAATLRGLHHAWIVADGGANDSTALIPAPRGQRVIMAALSLDDDIAAPIEVGIDAAWLRDDESGTQVFVFELVKAMVRQAAIARVVLLSERGRVPATLDGIPKVSGTTWADAVASGLRLDVLHRPYQPGSDTDLQRYRRVARTVAITILDFIAYDNPAYHESSWAFRAYQRKFERTVRRVDQLFAISRHIGDRLQRQFAHRLLAPVRSIHLGTDHVASNGPVRAQAPAALSGLRAKQFVAVLGNDFAHKNRDFAVKVFAEMCRRGYQGRLLLAGFHLDAGSSFAYELAGSDGFAGRVDRVGALTTIEKAWLLSNAEAVLYPTSSEGFGLIPFEAAAMQTPTAFVRIPPLSETMPDVPAAAAWRVTDFTDHVFSLLAHPSSFVESVNAAARGLTWDRCAAETIAGYREMLSDRSTWHRALTKPAGPGVATRLAESIAEHSHRAARRARRFVGLNQRT